MLIKINDPLHPSGIVGECRESALLPTLEGAGIPAQTGVLLCRVRPWSIVHGRWSVFYRTDQPAGRRAAGPVPGRRPKGILLAAALTMAAASAGASVCIEPSVLAEHVLEAVLAKSPTASALDQPPASAPA